jgi:hypothetical protein
MAVVVSLGVLPTAVLFAADFVEDAFGTPLSSPRTPVAVIPVLMIGVWTAVPAVLAAVAYRERWLGTVMALALALVSPVCVLYSAREVAHDPDASFVRLAYVFVPFWPNAICAGIVSTMVVMKSSRRRDHDVPTEGDRT